MDDTVGTGGGDGPGTNAIDDVSKIEVKSCRNLSDRVENENGNDCVPAGNSRS